MAHELDFSRGYAAMFAHERQPVWHQRETGAKILAYHPTVEQALAEAGLDYTVAKAPTQRVLPDGRTLPNTMAFSTVRSDTGAELGMVGKDYTPLQNVDALRVFQPLLDSGHCVIETAGALRGGADVWVAVAWDLAKFGTLARKVFGEDPRGLLPYSVVTNNHTGRRNAVGMDVTICPVCANTLGAGLAQAGVEEQESREGRLNGQAFAVRHTANVKEKLEEQAKALWADRVAMFEILAAQYQALKRTTLSTEQYTRAVLDVMAPDPRTRRGWNPEARMANTVIERFEHKRLELTRVWTSGSGHQGDHSAWEAYNGAVEVIDHDTELYPTRSGVYRTQALLTGELGRLKQVVLNNVVKLSQQ